MKFPRAGDPDLAKRQWEALQGKISSSLERHKAFPLLASLLGNSRFLVDWLLVNPSFIQEILRSPYWKRPKDRVQMDRELRGIFQKDFSGTIDSVRSLLRRHKYAELARIAARDLSREGRFEEIGRELAHLAAVQLEYARRAAFRLATPPRWEEDRFAILGLGKMGGEDLNFSSDLDILHVFDAEGKRLEERQDLFEYFGEVAQKINRIFQERTAEGIGYRVDLDLRPEGKSGPIVNSIDVLRTYYEVSGATWERGALIKASWVAGNPGVAAKCLKALAPFVYPRSLEERTLSEIKGMKEKINDELRGLGPGGYHVKLDRGGIREIEFFVAAFQLIYGGKDPELRERNTLEALRRLEEKKLVPPKDAVFLRESYIFLRQIENRLQMADERQLHRLPTAPDELLFLARRMGRESSESFLQELQEKTEGVARCFENLAVSSERESGRPVWHYRESLQRELSGAGDREEGMEILRRFKREEARKLMSRDLLENYPMTSLFQDLSDLASVILEGAYQLVAGEMREEAGRTKGEMAIVAMGKFGGEEMTYFSDLDLVFLYEDPRDQEFYTRLVQRVISSLTITTLEGQAYAIDARLRPSGRAGTLVSTLSGFREYHRTLGRAWERQSLVKARPLLGEKKFLSHVRETIEEIAYSGRSEEDLGGEIHKIRMRMEKELGEEKKGRYHLKVGRGGLADIEFVAQYLQMIHGTRRPDLRQPNTLKALAALERRHLLPTSSCEVLREAYLFYRTLETRIRMTLEHDADLLVEGAEWIDAVQERFYKFPLWPRYLKCRQEVREIYDQVFNRG